METKMHSQHFKRKRKFFLLLPLLVLPFITLLFWAMGGGRSTGTDGGALAGSGGLNMQLPDAYLKDDRSLDKLSYYEKAASDSAKRERLHKNDSFYGVPASTKSTGVAETDIAFSNGMVPPNQPTGSQPRKTVYSNTGYPDANEEKVYRKLNELNAALKTTPHINSGGKSPAAPSRNVTTVNSADIDRLEEMMLLNKSGSYGEDPELTKLEGLMEKVLDIQHPERVKGKVKEQPAREDKRVYAVSAKKYDEEMPSLLTPVDATGGDTSGKKQGPATSFYSLAQNEEAESGNAIEAVVHETQTIVDGAMVKLRLLTDIAVSGNIIPKGTFVFGLAALRGERLAVKINSLRHKSSLYPVQLTVVDMDGQEGIYVPGAVTRDVVKNSTEQSMQGIGMASLDPSISAQAARAGIETARTLLSRKVKLVKLTLKAGYQVLLQDEKQKLAY